jgi:hypothetical protein
MFPVAVAEWRGAISIDCAKVGTDKIATPPQVNNVIMRLRMGFSYFVKSAIFVGALGPTEKCAGLLRAATKL